jgi:hypothetical protein
MKRGPTDVQGINPRHLDASRPTAGRPPRSVGFARAAVGAEDAPAAEGPEVAAYAFFVNTTAAAVGAPVTVTRAGERKIV